MSIFSNDVRVTIRRPGEHDICVWEGDGDFKWNVVDGSVIFPRRRACQSIDVDAMRVDAFGDWRSIKSGKKVACFERKRNAGSRSQQHPSLRDPLFPWDSGFLARAARLAFRSGAVGARWTLCFHSPEVHAVDTGWDRTSTSSSNVLSSKIRECGKGNCTEF